MFCYNCGCHLSEHDFCTSCGADVGKYKKVMYSANRCYNDGLAKAKVRDLSGAIVSLRQCLKFNKNHIEARNLLGLVYFEMGEVVAALSEWVISKNLQPEKNIADDYISRVQSNASRLESINQTIKKYNLALAYCKQDSKDLAVIQLKKVLSLNTKFVRAHQLLALLYINSEQWEKAKRELNKCMDIDRNNTITLAYMKEVDMMLAPDENGRGIKKKNEEAVRFQSANEVIIQPTHFSEPTRGGAGTLLNIIIGLVIGVTAMYFLVVPSVKTNVQNDMQDKVTEISNQVDAKNSTIAGLESQVTDLDAEVQRLTRELEAYAGTDGTLQNMENLLQAANLCLNQQDYVLAADLLEQIEEEVALEETSPSFRDLYGALFAMVGPQVSVVCYEQAYDLYQAKDYAAAIPLFEKTVAYDNMHSYAWYYLAQAYRHTEAAEKAVEAYKKVIELVPDSDRASRAKRYIQDLTS